MKTCDSYVALAKGALGNPGMSDRELGAQLGVAAGRAWSSGAISNARYGKMTDNLAIDIAKVIGAHPGEVLLVAHLERETKPEVFAEMKDWLGKAFDLMPSKAAREMVRGGVRVSTRNP